MQTACLIYSQLDVTMTTKTSAPYRLFTQTSVVILTGHKWRQCNSVHKWPSTKVSNTSPFRIMENATLEKRYTEYDKSANCMETDKKSGYKVGKEKTYFVYRIH